MSVRSDGTVEMISLHFIYAYVFLAIIVKDQRKRFLVIPAL